MSLNSVLSFIIGKPVGKKEVPTHYMSAHKQAMRKRSLMRAEAQIGSTVFGAVPAGHTREFFCLDQYTWVWSERWFDQEEGSEKHMTVRYEFQPNGVLKVVDNIPRGYIQEQELKNLVRAMRTYANKVAVDLYNHAPIVA